MVDWYNSLDDMGITLPYKDLCGTITSVDDYWVLAKAGIQGTFNTLIPPGSLNA